MKMQPLLKSLSMILVGLMIPMGIFAQSITAPLDPTEAVKLPAAAGWRETSAVGFTYRESSGNRKIQSEERYKFDTSGVNANSHFKLGNLSVDVVLDQSSTATTAEKVDDGWINLDNNLTRVNIALSGNDFVTVGLGARNFNSHDFFDASHDSEKTTESGIIGSIAVKLIDFLYLGGGYERVKEKSSYTVENSWNNVTLGASVIFGEPGATRLRLEYSFTDSPRTESDAQGMESAAVHNETSNSGYAAELMFSGLLFSVKGTEQRMQIDNSKDVNPQKSDELTISKSEAGVLWVPESGIALGFYFASSRTSYFFEDEQTEFRINLAYVFE